MYVIQTLVKMRVVLFSARHESKNILVCLDGSVLSFRRKQLFSVFTCVHVLQIFDAIIICMSFAIDIVLLKGVNGEEGTKAGVVLIILLLWRITRVADGTCRAGQGRAGQGRAGQGRAGQGRAGQGRAGQGRAGQGRAGQGRAGQGRAGQGRAGQGVCLRVYIRVLVPGWMRRQHHCYSTAVSRGLNCTLMSSWVVSLLVGHGRCRAQRDGWVEECGRDGQ